MASIRVGDLPISTLLQQDVLSHPSHSSSVQENSRSACSDTDIESIRQGVIDLSLSRGIKLDNGLKQDQFVSTLKLEPFSEPLKRTTDFDGISQQQSKYATANNSDSCGKETSNFSASAEKSQETVTISSLPSETIAYILCFLRAYDLALLSLCNKATFRNACISQAIAFQVHHIYHGAKYLQINSKRDLSDDGNSLGDGTYRPDQLYIVEIKSMLAALSSAQPDDGKGYWISSGWMANAKKYYESCVTSFNKKANVKTSKKSKKQLDVISITPSKPLSEVNAEITCSHGGLSIARGSKNKRRVIDINSWKLIRSLYLIGKEFKCSRTMECAICSSAEDSLKLIAQVKKETEIKPVNTRLDSLPEILQPVFARKTGVPSHLITRRMAMFEADPLPDIQENTKEFYDNISGALSDYELASLIAAQENYQYRSFISDSVTVSDDMSDFSFNLDGYIDPFDHPDVSDHSTISPLAPGIYAILPREWLKSWRKYIKDPSIVNLKPFDITWLMCRHNKLIVPPHLDEYLRGLRRYLLGGLGDYPGLKVELLSIEEWECLHETLPATEFMVFFSIDESNVSYNIERCTECDPIRYDPTQLQNSKRRNPQNTRS